MDKTKEGTSLSIKESTIEMYDRTIEEMIKRGASEEELALIKNAKNNTILAYDENKPVKVDETEVPLMRNMFLVRIDGVSSKYVRSFSNSIKDKEISIGFLSNINFTPEKFFSENEKIECIYVDYLSIDCKVLRTDAYIGAKVKAIMPDSLYYGGNEPCGCYIKFKYKKYVPATD